VKGETIMEKKNLTNEEMAEVLAKMILILCEASKN
jgi:hypothetical protein